MLLKTGRDRSKALRGTMFTDPAKAAAWVSGVGENMTSIRETLVIETMSTRTLRSFKVLPPPGLESEKPSIVIGV